MLNAGSLVNLFAVKWYGETEFWMALGKGWSSCAPHQTEH